MLLVEGGDGSDCGGCGVTESVIAFLVGSDGSD